MLYVINVMTGHEQVKRLNPLISFWPFKKAVVVILKNLNL